MAISMVETEKVMDAFRRWGYLQADLDPVGYLEPQPHAELDVSGEAAEQARRYYCRTLGALFLMLPWLRRLFRSRPLPSVKRSASPSPAMGSAKAHEVEQKTLLSLAFTAAKAEAITAAW